MKWISAKRTPKKEGEYLVVWNLQDNQYPVTTCMDWDSIEKEWTDPRASDHPLSDQDSILYWAHLPKPPARIKKSIWYDAPEPSDEEVFESVRNDKRVIKYNPNPYTYCGRRPMREDYYNENDYNIRIKEYDNWEKTNKST